MRNHVRHLLTAYVHRQLPPAQRERVLLHVRSCPACRAALDREERLTHDLIQYMPQIGQPRPNQLARLWPGIWREFRVPPVSLGRWLPSYGLLLAVMLACAFFASALFAGPSHAVAAPVQRVPADIRPTLTPVRTDEPTSLSPQPSETARAAYLPAASPAPLVVVSRVYSPNGR
jgi:anti-sigma factor RsiW